MCHFQRIRAAGCTYLAYSRLQYLAGVEALVARIVAHFAADHDSRREASWIAEVAGRRVGCVFCVAADQTTAQLRILLVDPSSRGSELGGRLVARCIALARDAGYRRVKLWTNHPLVAARSVYLSRGFRLISEEPHHSFGVDLVGQFYLPDLAANLVLHVRMPADPEPSAHGGRTAPVAASWPAPRPNGAAALPRDRRPPT